MTLHQIRIFSTIAKHLNVTRAASELHISQPSVTYQLKLLEEEFGLRLYKKIARGIDLTRDGRLFLAETEPILRQTEGVRKKFTREKTGRSSGRLVVGGSPGPSTFFLPRLASVFREAHPRTEVTLRVDCSLKMEQMVRQSEIELAVTTTHSDSPSLIYERCRQEELVFLACPTHRLTKRQPTMAELAQASLIVFEEGNVEGVASILKKLEQRGLRLNIVMRCESAEAVKNAVKAGAGIGLLYRDAVRSEIDRGELKVIRFPGIEMCTESFIIYHGERALSADAKDFLALLHKSRTVLQAEQSPKHLAVAVQYKLSRLSLRSRGEYRFTDGKATSS